MLVGERNVGVFFVTTKQLCQGLPSWHCCLEQSSNHIRKITMISLLLTSKIIFLAKIRPKKKPQKVENNRILSLKYFCSHFCHASHKKSVSYCICLLLYYNCSLFYWVWDEKFHQQRKPVPQCKCVTVWALFSRVLKRCGIYFHLDKWNLTTGWWRREKEIKSSKSRNITRIAWLRTTASKTRSHWTDWDPSGNTYLPLMVIQHLSTEQHLDSACCF